MKEFDNEASRSGVPPPAPRRRRARRPPRAQSRWMWALLAALGLALAGVVVAQLVGSGSDPGPEPSAGPTAPTEQQTLLIHCCSTGNSSSAMASAVSRSSFIAALSFQSPPQRLKGTVLEGFYSSLCLVQQVGYLGVGETLHEFGQDHLALFVGQFRRHACIVALWCKICQFRGPSFGGLQLE